MAKAKSKGATPVEPAVGGITTVPTLGDVLREHKDALGEEYVEEACRVLDEWGRRTGMPAVDGVQFDAFFDSFGSIGSQGSGYRVRMSFTIPLTAKGFDECRQLLKGHVVLAVRQADTAALADRQQMLLDGENGENAASSFEEDAPA